MYSNLFKLLDVNHIQFTKHFRKPCMPDLFIKLYVLWFYALENRIKSVLHVKDMRNKSNWQLRRRLKPWQGLGPFECWPTGKTGQIFQTENSKLWPRPATRLSGQLQIYNTIFHVAATNWIPLQPIRFGPFGQLLANLNCDMSPVFGSLRLYVVLFFFIYFILLWHRTKRIEVATSQCRFCCQRRDTKP